MDIKTDNEILILDFDHTLFLSNSTEEYLNSAKPRTLCVLVLTLLDWLKVWNLFPGEDKRVVYRDAIRVIVVSICFPWSYLLYKNRIAALLKEHLNSEILELVTSRKWDKVIIASNGFDFIIKPLLAQINIQVSHVLSSQMLPTKDGIRAIGKRAYLKQILTVQELEQSVFISDNPEDQDVQGIVNQFVFYENSQAQRFRAGQDVYIPFVYTHQSKRGNKNHLLNVIIVNDYSIILLAYVLFNAFNIQLIFALLFLILSFWCIYEVGYFENDIHELKYESKHKNIELIEYIERVQDFPLERNAWLWAVSFSFLGLLLLPENIGSSPLLSDNHLLVKFVFWMIWLVATRLLFRVYNYSAFNYRVIFHPILQLCRLAGPSLFLPINPYGAFLIIAQAINRWFAYLMYRTGGDAKVAPKGLVRHLVFVMLVSALAVVNQDIKMLTSSQFLVILVWSMARGNLKFGLKKFLGSESVVESPKTSG